MHTVDIALFQNSVAFSLTQKRWGNRRKARIEDISITSNGNAVEAQNSSKLLRLSKILIEADEYDAIVSHQGETRNRIEALSVPSFFKRGIVLIGTGAIDQIESYMNQRKAQQDELVMRFAEVYPQKILEAEERLGKINPKLFDASNYPMVTEMMQCFDVRWNWIAFGVPDSLPQQLFEAEKAKAEAVWKDATDQITLCLRGGFKELVDHMVDRLTVAPGEDKKIFKNTLIGNMIDFLDTFKSRNIVNDQQLNDLVEQARNVMSGITPDALRKDEELRAAVAEQFVVMKANIDQMIEEMPTRTFDFGGDEEAA